MAFDELKERQAQIWGSAPFERVAADIAVLHDHLVAELAPRPGERWLDVGTGTGAVAVRAARAGAEVFASDLAPALIQTARSLAAADKLAIEFDVADVEELPYGDASFDVVSSAVGAMFAPNHERTASELARVTRPGGRLGLVTWNPAGGVGDFFRLLSGYQPPPPEGVGNPLEWGREEHVSGLLGDAFELRFEHADAPQVADSAEELWELFVTSFGPLKTLYDSLDGRRREELHGDWIAFMERHRHDGRIEAPREYLLTIGIRR
ncbi:MAG TPA: class I SAM-dependent methyltransferase [Gaiellaceae bacterium]|nr:class I SAM-dependent methyltransferase [Gaiellaceae bacterium]